jgi:hypothetical protein
VDKKLNFYIAEYEIKNNFGKFPETSFRKKNVSLQTVINKIPYCFESILMYEYYICTKNTNKNTIRCATNIYGLVIKLPFFF